MEENLHDNNKPGEANSKRPLLIFDGNCEFCLYWVKYWQQITQDDVDYKPYQDVADDYSNISLEEFQRSIQYITPEGDVSSGAKAAFKTISHGSGHGFWLWLYTWLPGFAFIAEKAYNVISKYRNFSFKVSKLLFGKSLKVPTYDKISWLFLRLFGLVFFIAFLSFHFQALGLIGANGIIPVNELKEAANAQLGWERYWYLPMVFWFSGSDMMIQLVCWLGMLFSILIVINVIPRISLMATYILYLSLIYAGQVFMSFQWDLLLVETALIAFFLIRYRTLGIWLLRWLTFRFMFAAGIVKITSGDQSWWDLTALNYHFLTQPLPTPLAWYAAGLPEFILKVTTLTTLIIELFVVFLIFAPRRLRFFAAFAILLLQICILLTGNYNFFNITTIILCLSLFDDQAISWLIPGKAQKWLMQKPLSKPAFRISPYIAGIFAVLTISLSFIQFQVRFLGEPIQAFAWVNNKLAPLRMTNTYGPFAVMTKKRYEIILEGSYDGRIWREYEFKYKPGDIYRRPQWNIPFQPRLDWQMWFAALGPANNSPWFSRLIQRLLENSPEVTALLAKNPFSDQPPTFVRALFFDYSFSSAKQKNEDGIWWDRWLEGIYFPSANLKDKDQ